MEDASTVSTIMAPERRVGFRSPIADSAPGVAFIRYQSADLGTKKDLVPEPTDHERIADLEAAGNVQDQRLSELEAAGLVIDEQMLALVKEIDGLHGRFEHRAVIEQAKGVIMNTMGCGPDAAFAVLVAQSQAQNRKVHEIATELARGPDDRGSE